MYAACTYVMICLVVLKCFFTYRMVRDNLGIMLIMMNIDFLPDSEFKYHGSKSCRIQIFAGISLS